LERAWLQSYRRTRLPPPAWHFKHPANQKTNPRLHRQRANPGCGCWEEGRYRVLEVYRGQRIGGVVFELRRRARVVLAEDCLVPAETLPPLAPGPLEQRGARSLRAVNRVPPSGTSSGLSRIDHQGRSDNARENNPFENLAYYLCAGNEFRGCSKFLRCNRVSQMIETPASGNALNTQQSKEFHWYRWMVAEWRTDMFSR
jgi:hypothetical protein